ncbi:bifunctional UDP-N-acetylmuramoyl-tripeptide:D-alanyl-D-alanine ligase/alanine racemase [Hoylesella shahii]|uniref:Alanine racemase n=1 Tax=Hoylesella shahii DSM 15611 = JCM 12083 TaxID=1122991 RepID=A0A318HV70_9BACT|nr:bifunctional UDP-N-acetylmuramoyl-tripeptide:D-alanyl-D-alanine ligase/alanine racemase [Hoylesella shahii]PXX22299.1 UDP-N-acetylmuramoyl-tripeptide--D-alanyl-D-alanine ligase [Hoylesella shahii DSM 15611 = JCM 12083]
MTYTIERVATLIGAQRLGHAEARISFVLTDSRSLCFPEETLFFALRSNRNDGHQYISELYRRGVRCFVVEEVPTQATNQFGDANFLVVSSTLQALQCLAQRHREAFNIPVVGITGSNGKTMVKEWLYQLLSPQMVITRSPRSYNSQIGVPLSVWLLNSHSQLGVFEAGISQKGEMQALHNIIRPTIAVLTNIGSAHEENFSSAEEKCREKLRLFKGAQVMVYNADDEMVTRLLNETEHKGERLAWSVKNHDAAMRITKIDKQPTHTTIHYIYKGGEPNCFSLPFIDDASVCNSIICATVGLHLGLDASTLNLRMSKLEPVAMRLEVKEGLNGCTLINDSYNSDINSLNIALDFMNRRPDHNGQKRTLVLSDILQSGLPDKELYQEVSNLAEQRGVQKFIGIGPKICANKACIALPERYFFNSVADFIRSDVFKTLHNEVVLLKGARSFGFDQLTEQMVKKVHETTLEVNLNAMVNNLNYYRSLMHPNTKLVCMIKADGYGAGAVEIAKTLQDHRADYLAVAVADEGATLRRNGITSNIMVMNPEMTAFKTIFDYDLEPEVYSFRLLEALIKAAEKEGITGFPVHIKLDTGMHRLGFDPDKDMPRLIERLHNQNALIPKSVFSHFAGADADEFDAFSQSQFERFDAGSKMLQAAFEHHILRHIDNSAGIEHFPQRQLDMCRLGLGLYGINPRNNAIINNVSTLRTTILQMREVKAGDTVGYSRRGTIEHNSVIAAIPIGYADGLNRKLGNRNGYCLVNNQPAQYVGNICMDVAMIDVTGIDCHEGDSVEIFGDNLPVTELSNVLQTIPYEVLTGISNRVNRVYFQD